jgi:energy-coupling factor transport system permease protein
MRPALAYSPRPGPLGTARPWIAALFLGPLALAGFAYSSPLVIASAALAALVAAYGSAAVRSALAPLRFGLTLAVTIVVVNAIASQRGETVLLRGWEVPVLGQIDVSAEALAEGGVLALRILAALVIFATWSACVDPDRILRGLRPWAGRSALTATLISRLVPLAAADASRIGEAASLRGPAASPVGRGSLARRLIAGSLDRSVDVAATLELRGYGLDVPIPRRRPKRRAGEIGLAATGAALLSLVLAGLFAGVGDFEAYPTVSIAFDPRTLALAVALPSVAALPFLTPSSRRRRRDARAGRGARDG